ncbi:MAG: hypothetical protein H0T58_02675 [Gemmatimonadales bacterium]|nr:hypothetical protein [Gemmatimonadales bacterium]
MNEEEGQPWESGGDPPWGQAETGCEAGGDGWRGELHGEDWPENLAGPEYWLYKRQRDE